MIEHEIHSSLIRQVLWNQAQNDQRARSALELLSEPSAEAWGSLNSDDIEYICHVLVVEFTATGLDANQEPNLRGVQIEEAIDWLRSKLKNPAH